MMAEWGLHDPHSPALLRFSWPLPCQRSALSASGLRRIVGHMPHANLSPNEATPRGGGERHPRPKPPAAPPAAPPTALHLPHLQKMVRLMYNEHRANEHLTPAAGADSRVIVADRCVPVRIHFGSRGHAQRYS
ncbi:hypothetical protein NDU88_004707 [Pleurodeles waltl]|uniref:Uncharacterized protein n=1 Tax=Pleurodeles waltl TaxID=8319 RepID=A0AAV7M8I1_PLEWA|nr:hypothetical protein NDU88_004707 [Pleurodeles waltl]